MTTDAAAAVTSAAADVLVLRKRERGSEREDLTSIEMKRERETEIDKYRDI